MHSIKRTDFIAWSRKKEPKRLPELETRVHCEARFHVSYTKRAKDDEFREISNGPTPSAMHRISEKKKRNRCSREVVQSWPWFLMIFALQLGHPRFAVHNSKHFLLMSLSFTWISISKPCSFIGHITASKCIPFPPSAPVGKSSSLEDPSKAR